MANKITVAEIFVQKVIDRVESEGTLPWKKPWSVSGGNGAHNALTGRYYNGINVCCLAPDSYLTFKQVTDLGGTVKKGATSWIVFFWKQLTIQAGESTTSPEDDVKKIPFLRYYRVFSVNDCDIPEDKMKKLHLSNEIPQGESFDTVQDADHLAEVYLKREGIPMKWAGNRAFYRPMSDSITLPKREAFKTAGGFYGTWFHEITHSTGAAKRLRRFDPSESSSTFGSKSYSKEELVAEIGSCFLSTYCGVEMGAEEDNSVAYLQGWLSALKNDPKMLISAHSKAKQAFEYVIGSKN